MASCQYVITNTKSEDEPSGKEIFNWQPLLKQTFLCTGLMTCFFMSGLCVGAPTVVVPQLRREANNTHVISDEMASWLSSLNLFGGVPWVITLSILTNYVGRKIPFALVNVCGLVSFLLFYLSTSFTHLLISQFMMGITLACQITISVITVSETTSPQYRGVFLTLKSAVNAWGIWVSNAIGTYFYWKTIGLVGICCALYSLVNVYFWPESPSWLASKGKFEECAKAHRWLKGTGARSEEELTYLIETQKKYLNRTKMKVSLLNRARSFFEIVLTEQFYKPTLLSITAFFLYCFSGKFICVMYSLDIIKKITHKESTAYAGMLILDGITVLSMYVGTILSKFLKRRVLLLLFTSIGILFLYIMSLYLYLVKLDLFKENNYVSIALLVLYSIAMSCGPMVLISSLFAEIIPIRYRSFSLFLNGSIFYLLLATLVKLAPFVFKYLALHGAFLFYAVTSSILTFILFKYLPETSNKSFQEIENSMRGGTKDRGESEPMFIKVKTKNRLS